MVGLVPGECMVERDGRKAECNSAPHWSMAGGGNVEQSCTLLEWRGKEFKGSQDIDLLSKVVPTGRDRLQRA